MQSSNSISASIRNTSAPKLLSLVLTCTLTACVGTPKEETTQASSTQAFSSAAQSSAISPPTASSQATVSSQATASSQATTSSQAIPSQIPTLSSANISSLSPASSSSQVATSSSVAPTPTPIEYTPGLPLLGSSGTFNDGKESFNGITNGSGNSVSWNRKAIFSITEAQENPWDIQLHHPIAVEAGLRITVCFRASANQTRTIKVDIDGDAPSYASLAYNGEEVTLTTQMQRYTQHFDIAQSDDSARLTLNLGGEQGTITIDDVGVFTGDECIIQETTASSAPSTPPNSTPNQPSYASAGTGGKIGSDTGFPCPGCLIGTPNNYDHSKATPLLITLHGDEGKPDFIHNRYYTRDGIAKKAGFIVASLKCPDSLECDNTNNTSTLKNFRAKNSWWLWERYENKYDPEWINQQVDKIEEKYNIDRRKIYFAGFSGGSVLLSTWGFENSERYAGMILSGGGAVAKTYRQCATKCPIPVYISIGKDDSLHKSATLTRDQAQTCGHEVEFSEHTGVGHVYIQSDLNKIMQWFLDRPHQCIQ